MTQVLYLVCLSETDGVADGLSRGWTQIAAKRFATPAKDDVRVVRRFAEMIPAPGGTKFIKARDFPADPLEVFTDSANVSRLKHQDAADFARFASDGYAEWVKYDKG